MSDDLRKEAQKMIDEIYNSPIYRNKLGRNVLPKYPIALADAIALFTDHHTKEAVLKARIDTYHSIISEVCEPERVGGRFIDEDVEVFAKELKDYLNDKAAQLAATEQKRGGE